MNAGLMTLILFGGMIVVLMLGVPVAVGLGALSIGLGLIFVGPEILFIVGTTAWKNSTEPVLITVPMFLLMGNFLMASGIADKMFKALNNLLSGARGVLAVATISACAGLDLCTGFGPGILTMGIVAVPLMLRAGYDKKLAIGAILGGGVGDLLPPSIMMIFYAYIARVSVAQFFFAGVVPGLLCYFITITYIMVICYIKPDWAPRITEKVSLNKKLSSLKDLVLPAALVIFVLGSIFFGIATPTEASAFGAVGALICCFIYRRFSWKMLMHSCLDTLKVFGMAAIIFISATIFSIIYTIVGAQEVIISIVESLSANKWVILGIMCFIILILGCFLDDWAIITIFCPVFVPIAVKMGFDPIWFGILFLIYIQIALLTPPFGWALILMKGVAPPRISTMDIWKATPPFIIIQLILSLIIIVFPSIVTWLPRYMISRW